MELGVCAPASDGDPDEDFDGCGVDAIDQAGHATHGDGSPSSTASAAEQLQAAARRGAAHASPDAVAATPTTVTQARDPTREDGLALLKPTCS